jgi:hypothetical protein
VDVIRLDRVVHDAKPATVRIRDAARDDSGGGARAQTGQSGSALHRHESRVVPRDLRALRMRNSVASPGSSGAFATTAVGAHFGKLELSLRRALHVVANDRRGDRLHDKYRKRTLLPE